MSKDFEEFVKTGEQLKQRADRRVELVNELAGATCFCGAKKRERQTFCGPHYFALPKPMRDRLYDGILDGYVEAYDAARKYLEAQRKET